MHNWEPQDISQNINDYDDFAIGQDFGFNHANAILLLGWKDGDIYILRELYGFEKDTAEWIAEANNAGVPKNRVMWCDSAEPDRIKMWKDAGYRAKGVNKGGSAGSVKAQIEWLKGSTDPNDKSKVIGRKIYVHPSCTNTIKELQQWKWKRDDRTGEYLDQPVAFQDDAMAALRYGVEGWRKMKRWTI